MSVACSWTGTRSTAGAGEAAKGGPEGEFDFDAVGDGLPGYNVVRNHGGRVVFVRCFEFAA